MLSNRLIYCNKSFITAFFSFINIKFNCPALFVKRDKQFQRFLV